MSPAAKFETRRRRWRLTSPPRPSWSVVSVCGLLGLEAQVAGRVADVRRRARVRLVAGRALGGLARRVGVRVRVDVERAVLVGRVGLGVVYGCCDGTASPPSDVVDRDQREPQRRARGRVLGEQARDVAQEQRHVVARRLDRGQERERRAQARGGQRQPVEPLLDGGVLPVASRACATGSRGAGRARRCPGRLRDAGRERVGEHRRARRQRREAGSQLAEQRRGVGQERPDRRAAGDHRAERRRRVARSSPGGTGPRRSRAP